MLLLIDTSGSALRIALAGPSGELLESVTREPAPGERGIQDERLAVEVDQLLRRHDHTARSLTRIGIVIGPGSFTGIRIGLAFAKGLCFGLSIPIVAVTSHSLLREAASSPEATVATAAYQKGLFYVSAPGDPIELMRLGERFPAVQLVEASLQNDFPAAKSAALALEVLARIASREAKPLSGDAISALEPLYAAEFNPRLA